MSKWLNKLDWKFFVMLVLGIASLYPAWLPYIQSPEKDLLIKQISQSALQPDITKDKDLGLEMTVDKIAVINPYLTVLRIENIGRQPILSKDFENALDINIDKDKSILRAQISEKTPNDLKPIFHTEKNTIHLDPILLNPHDAITLSVLSSEGLPTFSASARIAGITSIKVSTQENENNSPYTIPFLLFLTLFLITVSNAALWRLETTNKNLISYNRRTARLFNFVIFYTSFISMQILLKTIGYWSLMNLVIVIITLMVLTFPISLWLEKRPKSIET
jgi:hypothetical protein